MCDKSKVII